MGIAERKSRERQQRRDHFIDVAEQLIFQNGYEATTMDDIARAAEFSKRSIYLYFEDKRDLFLAVVLRGLSILEAMLQEAADSHSGGLDQLRAQAWAYYEFFRQHPPRFEASIDFEMSDYRRGREVEAAPEFTRLCVEINDRISQIVDDAVRRAVDQGAKTELQPHQVTLIVWGQVLGILQIISRRRDYLESSYGLTPRQLFERSISATLAGVFSSNPS